VPWEIVKNGGKCKGAKPWAVIKKSDKSTAGCFATEADAKEQLKALYANEKKGAVMPRIGLPTEERRGLSRSMADIFVTRADDNAVPEFSGHAAVFDSRTAIGNPLTWGFYEEIASGAFSRTISGGDARLLVDHDSRMVVARVSAGSLTLAQDKVGLAVQAQLDTNLSYVSDLIANLRNGNVDGMSFGFHVKKDEWTTEQIETSDGQPADVEVRRITEVELIEVSAVTFPAYKETDAGLRKHTLVPALRHRGDPDAVARLARYRPELAELLDDIVDHDPGESTRGDDSTTDPAPEADSGGSTRRMSTGVEARMRALKARFNLPAA
jgi:uncharacterized protein